MKAFSIKLNLLTKSKKSLITNEIIRFNRLKQEFIDKFWRVEDWDKTHYLRDSLKKEDYNFHIHHLQGAIGESVSLMKNKNIQTVPKIRENTSIPFTEANCKFKIYNNRKISKVWIQLSFKLENGERKLVQVPLGNKFNLLGLQKSYRIKIGKDGELYLICYKKRETKRWNENKEKSPTSIDIGYHDLLVTNKNEVYGKNFKNSVQKVADEYNEKIKKRSKLNSLKLKYKKKGNHKKYQNILKFNLGKRKWNSYVETIRGKLKTLIDTEINKFFKEQRPKVLIMEALNFSKGKSLSRITNRRLNFWYIGLIKKQLIMKARENGVLLQFVSPKNTSKQCSCCKAICDGNRKLKQFKCLSCGFEADSDYNAALNIFEKGSRLIEPKFEKLKNYLFESQSESEKFLKLLKV